MPALCVGLITWTYQHKVMCTIKSSHRFFNLTGIEPDDFDLLQLPAATRAVIEADSFWCTSRLLDGIQDNYTFAQPGIQMTVKTLSELIKRVDGVFDRSPCTAARHLNPCPLLLRSAQHSWP